MTTRRTKFLLSSLVLACCLAAGLPAQTVEDEWFLDKPIKDFSFTGLVTVKQDDLRAVVKPYLGQKFAYPLLWDIVAKLYALDYFESIVSNALPGDDAKTDVIIEFKTTERPSIVAVEVTGNASVRTGEITDKVLLKKGDLANQTKLLADIEAIKSLYLEKGFNEVSVSANFAPADSANTVKALFTIGEGVPTTIKEVRFSGNKFVSESTLRGLMKTKAQFLFDSGVFQESRLEEDKAAIVAYYTDHGFADAKIDKVSRDIQTQEGRNFLVLTVYLTEGEQWTYGGLAFSGNKIFSSERLAEQVYQKTGKVLSLQKVQADINRIQALYWENGYIFNTFERSETRDESTKTISYTLAVLELDKAHIESIIFKGNTRTAENVLRRGLPFQEGDIFNREKIIEGYQYLSNLQYFKTVTPEPQQGTAPGLMNIIYNVEETSTADINFGVVFSGGEFPISGTIKWNERNFMGKGQTLGVNVEASPIKQTLGLNFFEPWMLGVPWSVGFSLAFDHQKNGNVLQDILIPVFADDQQAIAAPDPYYTYDEYVNDLKAGVTIKPQYLMSYDSFDLTFGANTGYVFSLPSTKLGFRGGWAPQLRYITYDPMLNRPFEKSIRDNNNAWSFIDRITLSAYLDGRDIYWNPTKGFYAAQGLTFTGGILFGNRHYIRSDTTLEGFLSLFDVPVFENWNLQVVLAAHSALSMILPQFAAGSGGTWSWQTVTDYTDQLYIDGMTVGRGWRQLYGNAMWDNKLELRMPIVKEALWLVSFLDIAGLWKQPFVMPGANPLDTTLSAMTIDQLYFSLGFGIRFTIPQFPIRLYLAKGFQIQPNLHPEAPLQWKTGDLNLGGLTFGFVISLGGDTF
jgi:outer membrane protein insertion porin family